VNGDHWFVYVADHTIRSNSLEIDTDRVLNIMMFDIDESVSQKFYYDQYEGDVEGEEKEEEVKRISHEQTIASGINSLCPGAIIDPRAFEPCGYSMNAILFRSYTTIHITPESGSSYVSFETNQKVASYKSLISNVIRTFRPKRFVMTLMADEGGLKQVKENPMTDSGANAKIVVPATKPVAAKKSASFTTPSGTCPASAASAAKPAGPASAAKPAGKFLIYKRSSLASIQVEDDCCCMMGNWVLEKSTPEAEAVAIRGSKMRGLSIS
jgi:S-adenosylmethionine/arginine decarboxylase-like enzyme